MTVLGSEEGLSADAPNYVVSIDQQGPECRGPWHRRNISSTTTLPLLCAAAHSSGYKAGFAQGVTEAGCLAHSPRKFFDLHVSNKSQVAQSALQQIGVPRHQIGRRAHEDEALPLDLNQSERTTGPISLLNVNPDKKA